MSSLHSSSLPLPSERPSARLPTQAELDRQHLHTSFQPLVSALHQAIDDGDAARVKDELDPGHPRPNTEETLESAFERAVASGRVDIVGLLIDHGVSIRSTDLETAAKHGHLLVLALLMKLSHWPVDEVLDSGRTLLTVAAKHEGMVRWLLAQGASVNQEDGYGETPLSCAVKADAQEVIKMLLDSRADVTRGAPLHASLLQREGGVNLRLMGQLLELGAPVNKFQGEGSPL